MENRFISFQADLTWLKIGPIYMKFGMILIYGTPGIHFPFDTMKKGSKHLKS